MSDAAIPSSAHPAPHRARVGFPVLLFGAAAAPIFWLGQLMLDYSVSATACYGSDHPTTISSVTTLRATLIAFDAIAVLAVIAGAAASLWAWRRTSAEKSGGASHALEAGEGRTRFLALWGLMSSLWFFGAILFNAIASVAVPLCVR